VRGGKEQEVLTAPKDYGRHKPVDVSARKTALPGRGEVREFGLESGTMISAWKTGSSVDSMIQRKVKDLL